MTHEEIIDKSIDAIYSTYESDHSLRTVGYIHPMFYNGTFSENNSYQPPKPETLLTKEEVIEEIQRGGLDNKWGFSFQVLFNYMISQNK
jgi:hypothetical protein